MNRIVLPVGLPVESTFMVCQYKSYMSGVLGGGGSADLQERFENHWGKIHNQMTQVSVKICGAVRMFFKLHLFLHLCR